MADKTIGSLPHAPDLYDDSLLVAEQQSEAVSITGRQIKNFARVGVSQYVEDAKKAAQTAQDAAAKTGADVKDAQAARDAAQTAQSAAETARKGAETARKAIEDLKVSADTLPTGQPASVKKTVSEGHVKLTFGLPAGKKGDRGDPGSSIQDIQRTAGNGAAGTVDTYTVTLTDGSTHTFSVYNGADGQGAGDMTAQIYDPQGKRQDIFAYMDSLKPEAITIKEIDEAWENDA